MIAHYFIVAWETLSWVKERIMCRYLGYFSKGICERWLMCTKFVSSLNTDTSCPGASTFYSTNDLISIV